MVQDTISDVEQVVAESDDGTRLVHYDDGSGAVLERYDVPEAEGGGVTDNRIEYDYARDATLHFGLYDRVDGFDRPDRASVSFIPVSIAVDGRDSVAAWLYLNGGRGYAGDRANVADILGVTEHTVSRYLTRIRSDVVDEWE